MPFKDEITAGEQLIQTGIRSADYVMPPPSATGWRIARNGDSEFNNLTARGVFTTGVAPNPRVIINTQPVVGLKPAFGQIEIKSGAVGEVAGGKVFTQADQFARTTTYLMSNDMGFGTVGLRLEAPGSAGSHGLATLKNLMSNGQPLDFLVEAGQLAADLQPYGFAQDATTRVSGSLTYVGVAGQGTQLTMTAPLSNRLLLIWWALTNNATAGANTLMSAELRDQNLAGTILSAQSDIAAVRNNNTGNAAGMGFRYVDLSATPPASGQIYTRCLFRVTAGTGNFVQSALAVIALP